MGTFFLNYFSLNSLKYNDCLKENFGLYLEYLTHINVIHPTITYGIKDQDVWKCTVTEYIHFFVKCCDINSK